MADVSAVTNHFPVAKEGFTTTSSSSVGSGAATVPLNSVTGYANGDVGVWIIEPGNATNKQAFTGIVDTAGVQATNVKWTEGTNTTHAAGSTVVDYVSATHMSMVAKGLLVEHKQSGTHKDITADSVTVAGVPLARSSFNAPQGFMINGKITRTVASNNLTVAIKGLNDTDPSATNPVHVRIGDTVRSITSALSITLASGTNWFGMGASYFASNESDFFVYLIYNTSINAVSIGVAKEPDMLFFSDRSATTTDYGHLAISATSPAATDIMEVVGRFNAVLGPTASFNWSLPTTAIIINRPIYEIRRHVVTNTGSAGGTMYFHQKGADKTCWGLTTALTTVANGFSDAIVTFPVGFFSSAPSILVSASEHTTQSQQYAYTPSAPSAVSAQVRIQNNSTVSGGTAKVYHQSIGQ